MRNKELNVSLDVAGLEGTFNLLLYDLDEWRTLTTGSITVQQSSTLPPPFSWVPLLPFVGLAIIIPLGTVGFLHATGRLRIKFPGRPSRPKSQARHIKPIVPPTYESPIIEAYYKAFRPAAEEKLKLGVASMKPAAGMEEGTDRTRKLEEN